MAESTVKRVLVGKIGGAFGIRGDVRIVSYTQSPEAIAEYGELESVDGKQRFRIASLRPVKGGLTAHMAGIDDRNQAENLGGIELYVPRDRFPAPADGEFYQTDLVNTMARIPDGQLVGRVVAVRNFGAGDLLEVEPCDGGPSEFIAFTFENVPTIKQDHVELAYDPFSPSRD